ncbi:hypothetical protein PUNSTDRAFT_124894 [Punctularia strigosozonata HHB-11173 SS5]|uniref:uncharacterized protein n=1 Tax=Punctularia strigosozonata (strain HHB-11173) TaxID=741275 RepID=UPI00044180A7|nr:uncharacterized protein PUNSTDRAFT_124894 [Punctularia strigosozonata HHB-11173 SS5]EIN11630.1 hypothetical protein PUNSTDRAFT_124894 [Punctularia strigosozonata HHB-11173 SS5]
MSALFGGLGIVSVRTPVADWDWNKLPGEGEIRSLLFAFLFLVVFVVLAHLTNPSETSFRTFLTEQSFRQHLSRLDQSSEDAADADDYALPHTHKGLGFERPVHFANRASVSLRTPKHITHSFGILTVAAVVPDAHTRTSRADCAACTDDFEGASAAITDSWFVGAFGKWWRGGALDAWWLETMSKSKSEEGWTSGILGIKSLDRIASATGLSLSSYYSNRLFSRITPTSIRQPRGASSPQFPGSLRQRSLSPPPLPKSASLPLHTAPNLRSTSQQQQVQTLTVPTAAACDTIRGSTPALSRTSSTVCLDPSSPMISELLRQIGISKTTVEDLRNQLTDLQHAAAESHAGLQSELDEHRERRRQEEAARAELRARTKSIEDQRRAADAAKRDAEKRLKAAHTQRDHAAQRMAHLDKEIAKLRQRAAGDAAARRAGAEEAAVAEKEHAEQLAQKRKEIGIAEDVVAALNARARQLEEKIAAEKERLRRAREQAEARSLEQQATTILSHSVLTGEPASWGSLAVEPDHDRASSSPEGTDSSMSPRPKHLSLGSASNFSHSEPAENNQIALRAKGYSIFNDDLASLQHQQRSAVDVPFTPFGERDSDSSAPPSDPPITPLSSSLIPTSLIKSLDASEQFVRSDDDPIVGRETEVALRYAPLPPAPFELPHHASSLPIVLPGPDADDYDPFEVRPPPPRERADCFDTQRATFHRHAPEALQNMFVEEEPVVADKGVTVPRRWFSSSTSSTKDKDKEKPKRGLNPDAKVFSLARKKAPTIPLPGPHPATSGSALGSLHNASASLDTFDRLNPSIHASTGTPADAGHSLWSTISMRAFAPSPAEREALQRALGGSTNTSLDRLPTLSDVPGSLPATPPHVHAVAFPGPGPALDLGAFGLSTQPQRSSWLSNFGFMGSRKPKFSPWDDEETVMEKEGAGEQEKKLVVMEQ